MKEKLSFIIHLLLSLATLGFSVYCFVEAHIMSGKEYENWEGLGAGIGIAVLIIFGIFSAAFFLISVIPTLVSLKGIGSFRKRYSVTTAVFDIIFLVVFAVIILSSLALESFIILGSMFVLVLIALICNILTAREL